MADKKPNYIKKITLPCVLIIFLILAFMRFYAVFLEREVAAVERAIERVSSEEMSLSQQLSALKSPNLIYSYCKETLKMQRSAGAGVLKKTRLSD